MTGSRYTSNTGNEDIKLKFQFYINNTALDAYAYNKVEIYASYSDALSSINILETLPPASITDIGDGLVDYVLTTPTEAGTYFDKIYITPKAGYPEISFISAFYVAEEDFGGEPGDIGLCQVSGYILNSSGTPIENAIIKAQLNNTAESGDDYLIMNEPVYATTNELGFFTMSLIRSTEFTPNIQYTFDIKYSAIQKEYLKTIPDLAGINFNDL